MRTFKPWLGGRYCKEGIGGIRLLILGEAHRIKPGEEHADFTKDVIGLLVREPRKMEPRFRRFFTVTQRLVCGGKGSLSDTERADFWERVAFYNYIQSNPGAAARSRPTQEMWQGGAATVPPNAP